MGCTGSRLDGNGNSKPWQHHHRRKTRLIKDSRSRNSKQEQFPIANKDLGYQANSANVAPRGSPLLSSKHRTSHDAKSEDRKDHEKRSGKPKKEAAASNKNEQKTRNGNGGGGDDDDDYNADERMIGRQPGSPSFRVYFNDNGGAEDGGRQW